MEWKRKDRKVSRTSGNKRWETGEDRRTGGDGRGEDSCQPQENDPVGWWRDLICFSWLGIEVLRMEVAYQPMGKIWLLRHCYYVFLLSFTNSFPLSSLRIWSDVLCELLKMFCFAYIYDIIARKETTVWQQVLFLLRSERKPELWNTEHYLLQKKQKEALDDFVSWYSLQISPASLSLKASNSPFKIKPPTAASP